MKKLLIVLLLISIAAPAARAGVLGTLAYFNGMDTEDKVNALISNVKDLQARVTRLEEARNKNDR